MASSTYEKRGRPKPPRLDDDRLGRPREEAEFRVGRAGLERRFEDDLVAPHSFAQAGWEGAPDLPALLRLDQHLEAAPAAAVGLDHDDLALDDLPFRATDW